MSECKAASEEAERLVDEVARSGAKRLSLARLRISRLPNSLRSLGHQLVELDLTGCRELADLGVLASLSSLRDLRLAQCGSLRSLAPLADVSQLRTLDLRACLRVTDFSPLARLSHLHTLDSSSSDHCIDLRPLGGLGSLRSLTLSDCPDLDALGPLAEMRGLTSLVLTGNSGLTDLTPLSRLAQLQLLDLSGCSAVRDFSFLRELRELRILELDGCEGLREINALEGLGELRELGLSSCPNLCDLKPLLRLQGLKSLRVSGCSRIDDFWPLAELASLEALDLGYCTELADLGFLLSLPHLKHLDISMCQGQVDLQTVAHLTSLRNLRLRGIDSLTDLGLIAGLANLEDLELGGCGRLADIRGLAGLSRLRSLGLCACERLVDFGPLSGLVRLEHLVVSGCTAMTDLRCLEQLAHLRSLDLSGCAGVSDSSALGRLSQLEELDLTHCAGLTDLRPLAGLPRLQILQLTYRERLAEPAWVSQLTRLESLDLCECESLTDIGWLASLSNLQHLSLNDCNQLTDFSPLARLSRLERLEVTSVGGQFTNLHELGGLSRLQSLLTAGVQIDLRDDTWFYDGLPRLGALTCSDFRGAPRELTSWSTGDCFRSVERWCTDLRRSGCAPNTDIKVFFLGNGRAGKTQIVRRLGGLAFDPTIPSTHGIDIVRLPLWEASKDQPAIFANIWDFGGQDIYLGTHSLFLDNRAIYVLVWTPETEHDGTLQDSGIPLQHRRLDYWLAYVRELVGTAAPIVVVQSQCDLESQAREAPVPAQHQFTWLRRTACSAAREDGMEQLWPTLKAAARLLLERHGEVRLPKSWITVSATLRRLATENVKVLSRQQYADIALDAGSLALSTVLDYLHQSGQIFWRPDVFGGDVVLQQAWALEGIYAVLSRPHVMPLLRQMSGHFSRELLGKLLWDGEYTPQEQQHFISMMQSCGVCFPVSEGHWVAVDCLPERSAVVAREAEVWREAIPDVTVIVRYDLLHDGIRRSLLHAVGRVAGQYAVYWRHGVCLFDARQKVLIRIDCRASSASAAERGGEIVVETCGRNAAACAREIVSSIWRGIRTTRAPKVEWVSKPYKAMTSRIERAESDERDVGQPFAHIKAAPAPLPVTSDKPVVHISYAWRGESEAVVNALERQLNEHFVVRRDKSALEPGEWISRFMVEIGRSRCVVLVLSDRYLRSSYCMRELLYLYQSALAEKDAMLRRIVPVILADAAIGTLPERLSYASFWSKHCAELDAWRRQLDDLSQGEATRRELLLVLDFKHYVVDMLTWVSDVLMPRAGTVSEEELADAVIGLAKKNLQAQGYSQWDLQRSA